MVDRHAGSQADTRSSEGAAARDAGRCWPPFDQAEPGPRLHSEVPQVADVLPVHSLPGRPKPPSLASNPQASPQVGSPAPGPRLNAEVPQVADVLPVRDAHDAHAPLRPVLQDAEDAALRA